MSFEYYAYAFVKMRIVWYNAIYIHVWGRKKMDSQMKQLTIEEFVGQLCSNAPVPGGGGASSMVGALSAALCSMVAELTTGKKKYAEYQADIDRILPQAVEISKSMMDLMSEDAKAFEPLSKAYSIPKDDPNRDEILENALVVAAKAPLQIVMECEKVAGLLEELYVKGSRLALSDVGVAASFLSAAVKGAAMNVYINTKLMKNREVASSMNEQTDRIVESVSVRADKVTKDVIDSLKGINA